jgi:arsenate reductase
MGNRKKILFICTHNSARSQMAEGLLNSLYGDQFIAFSAGTEPSELNPFAVRVMDEIGIDISSYRAKGLDRFKDELFDYVITVCDHAKETCPFFPHGKMIHQAFADPSLVRGSDEKILDAFRKSRDEIKEWIELVLSDLKNKELYSG